MFNTKTCEKCGHMFDKDTGVQKDNSWFCKEHKPKWDVRVLGYNGVFTSHETKYYRIERVRINEDGSKYMEPLNVPAYPPKKVITEIKPTRKKYKRERATSICSCGWKGKRLKMHQTKAGHTN